MDTLIQENLIKLRSRVKAACERCGRRPEEITIVGVTKTYPAHVVTDVVAAGLSDIGESRIQEAEAKFGQTGHIARYHLIGHLQSNKAKKAVQLFDVIQSVDSFDIANEISRRAGELEKSIEGLIEINSSGEEQKYGVGPERALDLMAQVMALPHLRVVGFMTVGPLTDEPMRIRESFSLCHELFERAQRDFGPQITTLSMGMSLDFEIAIEQGSTLLRIGTSLFGSRA